MTTKIGIIGAGGMAQHHIHGFRAAGADVVAIADVNAEAAQSAAEAHEIPQSLGDVGQLLAMAELDAVSVIVPNKFHAPLTMQSLEAGKHVFCEKPPALNAGEVTEMAAVAERTGKTMMFNFNNRARPEAYAIMGAIADGTIGTINSAQAKWIRRTGIPGFGGWFTTKALSGGGPLIDLLHMLDLAMYFMGYPEPAHVLASTFDDFIDNKDFKGPWGIPDKADGTTDVEAAAHGCVTFASGQILTFQNSWAEMVQREEASVVFQGTKAGGKMSRLFGDDGLDDTAIDTCELYLQEGPTSVNRTLEVAACEDMGRSRSAENFIKTINGEEAPLNTPDQALALMKIIDATYESAHRGQAVAC